MRKIPTLFQRDPEDMSRVVDAVHPDCQWVLDGEGVPTRKYDGTCVLLADEEGVLAGYARREVKPDKTPPPAFVTVETDLVTGKTVGWEPIEQSGFRRFFEEAMAHDDAPTEPGTYELVGPKINGNPERTDGHRLIRHAEAETIRTTARTYEALRVLLRHLGEEGVEGIVWHHPDGRMAKLKVRDFGKPR